jgi:hypothetical protein
MGSSKATTTDSEQKKTKTRKNKGLNGWTEYKKKYLRK